MTCPRTSSRAAGGAGVAKCSAREATLATTNAAAAARKAAGTPDASRRSGRVTPSGPRGLPAAERPRGHCLQSAPRWSAPQAHLRTADAVEILDPDRIPTPLHANRATGGAEGAGSPVLDQQPIVEVDANAVVRPAAQGPHARLVEADVAAPADAEVVVRQPVAGPGLLERERDARVVALEHLLLEVVAGEVLAHDRSRPRDHALVGDRLLRQGGDPAPAGEEEERGDAAGPCETPPPLSSCARLGAREAVLEVTFEPHEEGTRLLERGTRRKAPLVVLPGDPVGLLGLTREAHEARV